jgi:mevalonate kinase
MTEERKELARTPFKVILFGEYAVLSGGRCIAFSINKHGHLYAPGPGISRAVARDRRGREMDLSAKLGCGACAEIVLEAPFGCGLGSSAVISLLLSYASSGPLLPSEILRGAHAFEDVFHGKASGVDALTSYTGGLVSFQNGRLERLSPEHLKRYKVLIYDSKTSKDTKDSIRACRSTEDIRQGISEIAEEAHNLLGTSFELSDLYKLFRRNQDLLEELGICTQELRREVLRMRALGIEAKITGGGCGGHLVTVVERGEEHPGWEEVEISEVGFEILEKDHASNK